MKKVVVLFIFFLCGCTDRVILNCSYVDNSSILGSKRVTDVIEFNNDRIISYSRDINFDLASGIKDSRSVYKIVKLEGNSLKKYIDGRYKIRKSGDSVNMSFKSKKIGNLKYIGIDSSYSYEQIKEIYSNLGFLCK